MPQATHAAIQFANDFSEEQKKWFDSSNSIITLSAKDERSLWNITKLLDKKGIRYSKFFEPDIGYALTAIALVPGPEVKKVCSSLPLAGKYNHPKAQDRLERTLDIIDAMNECQQSKGQSILAHGLAVRDRLFELINYLRNESPLTSEWRLPNWINKYRKEIAANLLDDYTLEKYAIFHDCGKPFCRIIDKDGKQHFPNHASKSAEIWSTISDDKQIEHLISADMDIHTISALHIPAFLNANKTSAISLLITGLAEIHANAEAMMYENSLMYKFGGIETINFKIKWKHIDKRGTAICNKLFNKENKNEF